MRIAVPTNDLKGLDGEVAQHFGRCPTYTFLDEHGKVAEIIDNTSEHMGGLGLPPELLKKHGADALLCEELGPRALALCKKLGIRVFLCGQKTVRGAFKSWKSKKAKIAGLNDYCEEHQEG